VEFEAVRAVGHVNFVWNFTDIPQKFDAPRAKMMEAASSSETSLYLCHAVTLYTPEHTQSSNEIPYVLKDVMYNARQFVNSCAILDCM